MITEQRQVGDDTQRAIEGEHQPFSGGDPGITR
jgi:hypothetical protein